MNARERFNAVVSYTPVDRPPLLEEGLRDDVREAWANQGLPLDADLHARFTYDLRHRLEVDLDPRPPLDTPPVTDAAVRERGRRLDPADPDRLPDRWVERVRQWRAAGHLVELPLHRGLFLTLGVGDWASLEPMLYAIADHPARIRRIMEEQAAFAAELADRILSRVTVDYVSFSEPIADNHGPLIGPATFRDLVLASYAPLLDVLNRHGVQTLVWMTYGNTRPLIGAVLDAGFHTLWAIETETRAMDYRALRREFGRDLRLIGGIDLDCLLAGPAAIDAELDAKVPPLLADGGYIPLADGRVRPHMPFPHYAHYRRRLEQIVRRG